MFKKKIYIYFLILVFCIKVYSQIDKYENPSESGLYFGVGAGLKGIAYSGGLIGIINNWYLSPKFSGLNNIENKRNNIVDFSLLFGKRKEFGMFTITYSSGIGLVLGDRLKKEIIGMELGLPLNVQLYRTPKYKNKLNLSYGLEGFANINRKSSFYGVTLIINSFGKYFSN